jgi:transcriptional regulator with XRE-family HTH domain
MAKTNERSFITDFIETERKRDPEFDREYTAEKLMHELISARLRRNISQDQLAERMNTQQPAIARMEKRPQNVSISKMLAYAGIVGVTLQFKESPAEPTERGSGSRRSRSQKVKE